MTRLISLRLHTRFASVVNPRKAALSLLSIALDSVTLEWKLMWFFAGILAMPQIFRRISFAKDLCIFVIEL